MDTQYQTTFETLERLRDQILMAGGLAKIEWQHQKGKLTARERIELLLDEVLSKSSTCLKWAVAAPWGKIAPIPETESSPAMGPVMAGRYSCWGLYFKAM